MGRKKDRKPASAGPADPGPTGLAALLAAKGLTGSGAPEAPAEAPPAAETTDPFAVPKVVVRRQRKGRGGRTVTRVEGLAASGLPDAAKVLGKALGVGATVRDEAVEVQGDQRERLVAWLGERGVRRVIDGG